MILGFEYFSSTNSITVHKQIEVDGNPVRHSMAFTCDMLEELKKYLGNDFNPLVVFCETFWTPEVIGLHLNSCERPI